MAAALDNRALVDKNDLVAVSDGAQAMCNHYCAAQERGMNDKNNGRKAQDNFVRRKK